MPCDDNQFDAVWNANVSQYLSDEELAAMLAEFRRVLKPGGVLAIKEFDYTTFQIFPFDPIQWWDRLAKETKLRPNLLRTLALPSWVRQAGFINIAAESYIHEERAPLSAEIGKITAGTFQFVVKDARNYLTEEEWEAIQPLAEIDAPEHPLNHPDFYLRESHLLTMAMKVA